MGKKKLSGSAAIIDLDSPSADSYEDALCSHRTCWKHTQAFHARSRRITKKRAEEIEGFKLSSPCFLKTFPHRKRSNRKPTCTNAISKLKQKLDSRLFECYMENLWSSFSEDKRMSFTYLDSLWFVMYKKASSRRNVLEWIKRKDIFSKKYVFVPIVCWRHWSLLIFCHFGESLQSENTAPCMLLLDSLEMANPRRLEPEIRKFVWDIYRSEDRPETKQMISKIPLLVPKVLQQKNDVECGKYVLYFVKLFMQDAPENFDMMDGMWFSPEGFENFCEKLEIPG